MLVYFTLPVVAVTIFTKKRSFLTELLVGVPTLAVFFLSLTGVINKFPAIEPTMFLFWLFIGVCPRCHQPPGSPDTTRRRCRCKHVDDWIDRLVLSLRTAKMRIEAVPCN